METIMDFLQQINGSHQMDSLIKLVIAAFIGIIIGFERELKKKPVGIKTLLVIAVGSTLLTIISIESVAKYAPIYENVMMDPLRLPAQIVSGIGFLGAGVIWKKTNDVVSGLTTAAIVWGVGGIGIAIGTNFITEAFFALILFLLGVEIIPSLAKKIFKYDINQKVIMLKLTLEREQSTKEIMKAVKTNKINIRNVRVYDNRDNKKVIEIRGFVNERFYVTDLYEEFSKLKFVQKIDINE